MHTKHGISILITLIVKVYLISSERAYIFWGKILILITKQMTDIYRDHIHHLVYIVCGVKTIYIVGKYVLHYSTLVL